MCIIVCTISTVNYGIALAAASHRFLLCLAQRDKVGL